MNDAARSRGKLRSPLARHLIIGIVLVSSAITLCLTAVQLYGEYRYALRGLDSVLRQIEGVHLTPLTRSLWATNANDLRSQLEGMVQVPNLEYAAVREGDKLWAEAGRRTSKDVIERQYPMIYMYQDRVLEIGRLTVVAGLDGIYRQLLQQALVILGSNALKTLLVVGFVFVFFHWLVNRHLLAIADYVRGIGGREVPAALKLPRRVGLRADELDELAGAINLMQEQTRATIAALRESEARLRLATEAANVGMWQRNLLTNESYFSPEFLRELGYVPGELAPRYDEWASRLHPEDRARVLAALSDCLEGRAPSYEAEYRLRHKDGSYRWFLARAALIRDDSGRPVRLLGVVIEITARKETEEALRQNERRLRSILDSMFGFVGLFSPDGTLVEVNRAPLEALGLIREEVIGKPFTDLYAWSYSPRVQSQVREALRRAAAGEVVRTDLVMRAPRGQLMTIDATFSPLKDVAGRVIQIVGSGVDITERIRLEEQLRQVQKMEALGTLAGGIAHDFNNILGAIIGNVELAHQDIGPGHAAQESLGEIGKAAARARDLVRQILTFSRQQAQERRVIQLHEVVEESVKLLRATLPAGIELITTFAGDTPNVLADRTQVHQVIMNLCTNAWQAMGVEGGRIEIALGRATVGAEMVHADLRPGHYARLTVADTGKGMDAATAERIFDPFFTTKALGEGTGLGLAVVSGIVRSHRGAIVVQSAPDEGTVFHLYFPAIEAEAELPAGALSNLPHGNGQRILYLDDEEPLVSLTARLLHRLGYEVYGCTRVAEALAAFQADPAGFDALVTDLNMPGASGLEVAAKVLAQRPGLPIGLTSGYVTDDLRAQARALGIREVIYKPNTVDELAAAIGRLVDLAHEAQ